MAQDRLRVVFLREDSSVFERKPEAKIFDGENNLAQAAHLEVRKAFEQRANARKVSRDNFEEYDAVVVVEPTGREHILDSDDDLFVNGKRPDASWSDESYENEEMGVRPSYVGYTPFCNAR